MAGVNGTGTVKLFSAEGNLLARYPYYTIGRRDKITSHWNEASAPDNYIQISIRSLPRKRLKRKSVRF